MYLLPFTFYRFTACLDFCLISKQNNKKQPADGFFNYAICRRFEFLQIDTLTQPHG
jgi:hypothetical protein